jgi:hypothetical protein
MAANDRTVNKVALYSAIFAGVAYVGYSCVKNAFGKSKKRKQGKQKRHFLCFYDHLVVPLSRVFFLGFFVFFGGFGLVFI